MKLNFYFKSIILFVITSSLIGCSSEKDSKKEIIDSLPNAERQKALSLDLESNDTNDLLLNIDDISLRVEENSSSLQFKHHNKKINLEKYYEDSEKQFLTSRDKRYWAKITKLQNFNGYKITLRDQLQKIEIHGVKITRPGIALIPNEEELENIRKLTNTSFQTFAEYLASFKTVHFTLYHFPISSDLTRPSQVDQIQIEIANNMLLVATNFQESNRIMMRPTNLHALTLLTQADDGSYYINKPMIYYQAFKKDSKNLRQVFLNLASGKLMDIITDSELHLSFMSAPDESLSPEQKANHNYTLELKVQME